MYEDRRKQDIENDFLTYQYGFDAAEANARAVQYAKRKGQFIAAGIGTLALAAGAAAFFGGSDGKVNKEVDSPDVEPTPFSEVHPDATIFDAPFYAPVPPVIVGGGESAEEAVLSPLNEDIDDVEQGFDSNLHIKKLNDIEQGHGMWMPMGCAPVIQKGSRLDMHIPFSVGDLEGFNDEMAGYIHTRNLLPEFDGTFEYITNGSGDRVTIDIVGKNLFISGRWVGYGGMYIQVLNDRSVVISPESDEQKRAEHDATEWGYLDGNGKAVFKLVNTDGSVVWVAYDEKSGWTMTFSADLDGNSDWLEEFYGDN